MITMRKPRIDELPHASDLCLRSKAYWGYDDDFISACIDELTLSEADLVCDAVILAFQKQKLAGLAQVSSGDEGCYLEKLFVDPMNMGEGVGRHLFEWSVTVASQLGAKQMIIEADPGALPFYKTMLCEEVGSAESGSIPGRRLPRLIRKINTKKDGMD